MAVQFNFRRAALKELERNAAAKAMTNRAAEAVRDRARRSARKISGTKPEAIVAEPAVIEDGIATAKVGYEKSDPGFVLWFHEVGTQNHAPTPHLRAAMRGRI